ncbi:hypothetical protein HK104_002227 [Borealophlyctis nickersoniae]|nr:hypothetical protein HK104_002227 [Borealophlyctis nickersoniae]
MLASSDMEVDDAPVVDFTPLKRPELQRWCKQYNLKANGKNTEMAERLRQFMEQPQQTTETFRGLPEEEPPTPGSDVFLFGIGGQTLFSPAIQSPGVAQGFSFTYKSGGASNASGSAFGNMQREGGHYQPWESNNAISQLQTTEEKSDIPGQPGRISTLPEPPSPQRDMQMEHGLNAEIQHLNNSMKAMSVEDDMDVQLDAGTETSSSTNSVPITTLEARDSISAAILAELENRARAEAPALKAAGLLSTSASHAEKKDVPSEDGSESKGKFESIHQKQFSKMASIAEHFAAKRVVRPNVKGKEALGDKRRTADAGSRAQKRLKIDKDTAKPRPVPPVKPTVRSTPRVAPTPTAPRPAPAATYRTPTSHAPIARPPPVSYRKQGPARPTVTRTTPRRPDSPVEARRIKSYTPSGTKSQRSADMSVPQRTAHSAQPAVKKQVSIGIAFDVKSTFPTIK